MPPLHQIIARPYLDSPYCAAPLDVCVRAAMHMVDKANDDADPHPGELGVSAHNLVLNIEGGGNATAFSAIVGELIASAPTGSTTDGRTFYGFNETETRRRCVVVDLEAQTADARVDYAKFFSSKGNDGTALRCVAIRIQDLDNATQPALIVS
jgi:hypothetical protein